LQAGFFFVMNFFCGSRVGQREKIFINSYGFVGLEEDSSVHPK